MKFLLDANIPYSAKAVFVPSHEAIHVQDAGLSGATDEAIIAWAKKHRAALITRDLGFGNIVQFPPRRYHGIIVLRLPPSYAARDILRILSSFLASVDSRTIPKTVIIVEEGRVRIRK